MNLGFSVSNFFCETKIMRLAVTIIFIALFIAIAVGLLTLFLSSFGKETQTGDGQAGPTSSERIQISQDSGKTFTTASISPEAKEVLASASLVSLFEDPDVAARWWLVTNAAIFVSEDNAATWDFLRNANNEAVSGATAFARETGSSVLYVANVVDGRGRIFRSDDLGKTFLEVFSTAQTDVSISSLSVDPAQRSRVLAGMSDGFSVVSSDRGTTWTTLGSFQGTIDRIVFSPQDPNIVFMTILGKGILSSGDGGTTWGELGDTNLSRFRGGTAMLDLAILPGTVANVVLATEAGLLVSDNAGIFNIVEALVVPPKSLPILSVSFNPLNALEAYVSARNGLYKTKDFGETWEVTRLAEGKDLRFVRVSRDNPSVLILVLATPPKKSGGAFRLF